METFMMMKRFVVLKSKIIHNICIPGLITKHNSGDKRTQTSQIHLSWMVQKETGIDFQRNYETKLSIYFNAGI